mgnify:CR=1 FL=1
MTESFPKKPVNKWLVLVSVAMGVFLATIDGSIVNIGLNTLVNDLQQPLHLVEWVVLAYMLTISTLLLSVGLLSNVSGNKKVYRAGIIGLIRLLVNWFPSTASNWSCTDDGNWYGDRNRSIPFS